MRSARLAALASVPARRQPNLSRRDCLQLPHPALGLRRSPLRSRDALGPGRLRRPAAPPRRRPLRAREGPAPPQMPLRGRVSPVDGLLGPRQYRDEGPPPLGPQKGLHGFWRCPPPPVTGYAPPPSVLGVRGPPAERPMAGPASIRNTHNVADITSIEAEKGRHPSPGVA